MPDYQKDNNWREIDLYIGMKRIAIIGSVGIPATYGGFETLTEYLVKHLQNDVKFEVYCSGKHYSKAERKDEYLSAQLKYIPLKANGVWSVLYDILSMLLAFRKNDAILVLGVSGAFFFPIIRLLSKTKLIVNLDGVEWKRDKWNGIAKWFLKTSEKIAIKFGHQIVTDNESLKELIEKRYKVNTSVIAYGADHVNKISAMPKDFQKFTFLNMPYAFSVCRIEPENNIKIILEAFKQTPKKLLVLVGNWQNSAYGKNLFHEYGKTDNIILLDPIYDQNQLDLLRSNASLYVHGHSAGGTNPSLVEAMYLGLPIAAFDVCFNRSTSNNKAIYFDSIEALKSCIGMPFNTYNGTGEILKEIAFQKYTWAKIAKLYLSLCFETARETKVKQMEFNYPIKSVG